MLQRFAIAILLASPLATSLTTSLAAAAVTTPAAEAAKPTINVTGSVVTLGTRVAVYGETPSLLQPVRLEVETAENGWQEVDRGVNILTKSYSFEAPGWYGTHRLRVHASATLLAPASVSDIRTVTVKTAYDPKGESSDWSWISHKGARWDPCSTITYRINPTGGSAEAAADIKAALRNVGRIMGFRYNYAGTTKSAVRRDEYGSHPPGTDLLIDWQRPGHDSGLSGKAAGRGGHWVLHGRRFDGYVVLNQNLHLSRAMWRRVMAHEIGHVVGLGHAKSPSQVMHSGSALTSTRWGAGDLAGLHRLGASRGCLERPSSLWGSGEAKRVSLPAGQ